MFLEAMTVFAAFFSSMTKLVLLELAYIATESNTRVSNTSNSAFTLKLVNALVRVGILGLPTENLNWFVASTEKVVVPVTFGV